MAVLTSYPMATCPECRVSHVCRLMISNQMRQGAVQGSPGIYFTAEKNSLNHQLGDRR
jgi:hypothetical protein